MTKLRDLIRKRRVSKYIRNNGWCFNYCGVEFILPPNTEIEIANALIKNKYETEEVHMISSYIPPNNSVIELGGSFGIISGLISKKLNNGAEHIIVEANPLLREVCLANAKAGSSKTNIKIVQKAICYNEKMVEFNLANNPHSSSLFDLPVRKVQKTIKIPSITLNEIYQSLENPIDYTLVCDIEGSEEDMVINEMDTLAKAKTIIMELHPNLLQSGQSQIPIKMKNKGFIIRKQIGTVFTWTRD